MSALRGCTANFSAVGWHGSWGGCVSHFSACSPPSVALAVSLPARSSAMLSVRVLKKDV